MAQPHQPERDASRQDDQGLILLLTATRQVSGSTRRPNQWHSCTESAALVECEGNDALQLFGIGLQDPGLTGLQLQEDFDEVLVWSVFDTQRRHRFTPKEEMGPELTALIRRCALGPALRPPERGTTTGTRFIVRRAGYLRASG